MRGEDFLLLSVHIHQQNPGQFTLKALLFLVLAARGTPIILGEADVAGLLN